MNADERRFDQSEMSQLTEKVIRCAFAVSNTLGCGFLEKVYENALAHELRKAGLKTDQQQGITVHYDGVVVGEYAADLLVEGALLVELKAVKDLDDIHLAQCLNYLRATNLRLCLLMNFAKPKVEIRRIANNYGYQRLSAFICGFRNILYARQGRWRLMSALRILRAMMTSSRTWKSNMPAQMKSAPFS